MRRDDQEGREAGGRLGGRCCLVTGGSSGVGRATALGLAKAGASVVIVTRSAERGRRVCAELRAESGNEQIASITGDLSSPESVREVANEFMARWGKLHVLSNNAAVLTFERVGPNELSPIIKTNYLGHFLLTNLLLDRLKRSAPSRVLTVSGQPSAARRLGSVEELLTARSPFAATVNAMRAKVLFTRELSRRLAGSGVTANTFHPGLVSSQLGSHLPLLLRIPYRVANAFLSAECPTGVFLATSESVEGTSGQFFVRCKPVSYDPPEGEERLAAELWEESARLTGIG